MGGGWLVVLRSLKSGWWQQWRWRHIGGREERLADEEIRGND
jgi:hypothetical protein